MPALDRNVKVTWGNCGTSVTKKHLSRHKLCCSGGTLYSANCPNFSTKSRDDLIYHIAKKHATPRVKTTHKCKIFSKSFLVFMRCDNTKQASMEFRWNQLNFTWITSLKITTQTSKKNCKHVNLSSFILSLKKEDIVFSISPCQPSTTLWLMINWIYYAKDSNALPKLPLLLDLFSKT